MLCSVQQHGNINVRGFLILKTNILARIVNACLYFVMVTVPYLLYITTRLYLNTTYTVPSIKNGLKNNQQVNTNDDNRYITTNGVTIINVGADNIAMSGDDNSSTHIWLRVLA